jgi:hypothetical protein
MKILLPTDLSWHLFCSDSTSILFPDLYHLLLDYCSLLLLLFSFTISCLFARQYEFSFFITFASIQDLDLLEIFRRPQHIKLKARSMMKIFMFPPCLFIFLPCFSLFLCPFHFLTGFWCLERYYSLFVLKVYTEECFFFALFFVLILCVCISTTQPWTVTLLPLLIVYVACTHFVHVFFALLAWSSAAA